MATVCSATDEEVRGRWASIDVSYGAALAEVPLLMLVPAQCLRVDVVSGDCKPSTVFINVSTWLRNAFRASEVESHVSHAILVKDHARVEHNVLAIILIAMPDLVHARDVMTIQGFDDENVRLAEEVEVVALCGVWLATSTRNSVLTSPQK